jgi:hypothetical protein
MNATTITAEGHQPISWTTAAPRRTIFDTKQTGATAGTIGVVVVNGKAITATPARSSFSVPRETIPSAWSGKGSRNAFASPHSARISSLYSHQEGEIWCGSRSK